MRAYRSNDPKVEAFKEVTVIVDRNPTEPRFSAQDYTFTIPENQRLGLVFGNISATDPDSVNLMLLLMVLIVELLAVLVCTFIIPENQRLGLVLRIPTLYV